VFDLDAYLARIGLSGRPGIAEVHRAHTTTKKIHAHSRKVPVTTTVRWKFRVC
jgi:hypothetical protein